MLDAYIDDIGNVIINDESKSNIGDPVLIIDRRGFVELARFLLNADQELECETRIQGEMGKFLD